MKTRDQRLMIAFEMIRRADTVTVLREDEIIDIKRRAQAGEFDDIFDNEEPQASFGELPK